jgi:hypothetical protein
MKPIVNLMLLLLLVAALLQVAVAGVVFFNKNN